MTGADRRKLNKDAGFSLVELLIAVVILAIIVIPLMNLFVSSNRINIKSRKTLRATTAAQDIMEGLKAYNIEEVKEQFADPASGFYVIDSRLIKGEAKEEEELEKDPSGNLIPGLYVFSMRDVTMQGSKFDAKIVVDGRGYMTSVPSGTAMKDHDAHLVSPTGSETYKFNDAAMADARSIDKNNGTFVETDKIRQAVLKSVFKDTDMRDAVELKLKAKGVADVNIDDAIDAICFKSLVTNYPIPTIFDQVSRTITIDLTVSAEVDEDGNPKVDMEVTQIYDFICKDAAGANVEVHTAGDMGSGIMVNGQSCGSIARMVDAETDDEKINVNLFYYPLYGASSPDKIIINNGSGADLNLLIAKQRYEKPGPADPANPDPEYLSDSQLMSAEQNYHVDVQILDGHGAAYNKDKFALKTNLGLNLVGEKYLAGAAIELPAQFTVNGTNMDLSGSSGMNIFTLDGVRSPMGKDPLPGEGTELIYDVQIGIYEEGAAASGFPDDMRKVVIGGSMTN